MDIPINWEAIGAALDEHAIVSMTDAAGNITYANQHFLDISGYSLPELLGKNHRLLKSGIHPPSFYQLLWDTLLSGKTWHGEVCNRRKDGGLYWVRASVKPILDGNGMPVQYISIRTDITERELQMQALQESEQRFRTLFQHSPVAYQSLDIEGHFLDVNDEFCQLTGYTREEILNKCFDEIWSNEAKPLFSETFAQFRHNRHVHQEVELVRSDGSQITVLVNGRIQRDENGKFVRTHCLLTDISERKKYEQALSIAREQAESANKAKSEFLASMSHELRTPMNAILGFAQLMEGDTSNTADQRENLQQISKAGWHLLDLINEVLDLARVESGEIKLTIEEIDPAEIVAECLSLVSPLIAHKEIVIDNRISAGISLVRADYMRLKQVLINLLSNAIKYNRDAGAVVLELTDSGGSSLALTIQDTGQGMTPEQLEQLFESFTRFGDTDKVQGTGIGLSICKKLVERMNGKILVASALGEGSTFSVVLPRNDAGRDSSRQGADGMNPDLRKQLSLLYIEDDAAQQSLLGKWAHNKGWQVEFAHDAASGIDAAMKCRYDAILLDINLPGGFSGLDVKSVLNDMESLRTTPVIGISNLVQPQDLEKAMQAGFAAYLPKPVDLLELERVLQRAIRSGREE